MAKVKTYSCHGGLGKGLRLARHGRLTQAELAELVGTTQPAVAYLESGQGGMAAFQAATAALGLELSGRGLPPGETLGERFRSARRRQGFSLAALAEEASVSEVTVTALERDATRCHVRVVDRVAGALGCRLMLVPIGMAPSFYAGAGNTSVHQAWQTPQDLLEQLYLVFGKFDLDPCSPTADPRSAPVKAKRYLTADDDALAVSWSAETAFINPPYDKALKKWIAKCYYEYSSGNTKTLVLLIPARPDTRAWHAHVAGKGHIVMFKGRLCFTDEMGEAGPAPFPSALVVYGPTEGHIDGLKREFADSWHLPVTA